MKIFPFSIKEEKSVPKLFAWIASTMLIILIIANQFLPRGHQPGFRFAGVVILLIAPLFIFSPFFLLSKHGNNEVKGIYMQPGKVVDKGLFAILRHPQYLGYMMLAGGFALLSQNLVVVCLAVISIICFFLQALQEEKYCLDQFGNSYQNYLKSVPRFNFILGIWRIIRG
jgi:protein-S-isoprenylcysteine O-methyltransferase Ste14